MEGIRKGYLFLPKMVHGMVRGRISGRSLPVLKFFRAPPPSRDNGSTIYKMRFSCPDFHSVQLINQRGYAFVEFSVGVFDKKTKKTFLEDLLRRNVNKCWWIMQYFIQGLNCRIDPNTDSYFSEFSNCRINRNICPLPFPLDGIL